MAINSTSPLGAYSFFRRESTINTIPSYPVVIHTSHLNYWLALGLIFFTAYLLRPGKKGSGTVDAPFYKASKMKWMFDAESLVRDSYNKYHEKVYQIKATEGVQVLIPPGLLGELKGLPESVLSSAEAVNEAMMTEYTHFTPGRHAELLSSLLRTKLSSNLARLVPQLKSELDAFVSGEFPPCEDWTPVKVQPTILRAFARLSGRVFVGPELNTNEQWMDTSINFAVHVFVAVVKLQFFPAWLRPLGQYLVSDIGQIRRDISRAEGMLRPIVEERLRDMEGCPAFDQEKPDDFIQWALDSLPDDDSERRDFMAQSKLQLILSAAAIHTSTNLLTDSFFDLAAHPDVQEMLRQEVMEVLGDEAAWSQKESMAKLKKMDSFIKEVQRLAGNVTSFIRRVVSPIELSDGTRLPCGTKLLAPLAGISHDERFFSSPEEFDALRFYRIRQSCEEEANRHLFTSISGLNVHFGAGSHVCPGRFFAGNVIKMVLAHFLLSYDMRLKDGESRPKSMMIMMSKTPDPKSEILFRRRPVGR